MHLAGGPWLASGSERPARKGKFLSPVPRNEGLLPTANFVGSIALASGRQPLDPVCGGECWAVRFSNHDLWWGAYWSLVFHAVSSMSDLTHGCGPLAAIAFDSFLHACVGFDLRCSSTCYLLPSCNYLSKILMYLDTF